MSFQTFKMKKASIRMNVAEIDMIFESERKLYFGQDFVSRQKDKKFKSLKDRDASSSSHLKNSGLKCSTTFHL